jgi:hypothetical protein
MRNLPGWHSDEPDPCQCRTVQRVEVNGAKPGWNGQRSSRRAVLEAPFGHAWYIAEGQAVLRRQEDPAEVRITPRISGMRRWEFPDKSLGSTVRLPRLLGSVGYPGPMEHRPFPQKQTLARSLHDNLLVPIHTNVRPVFVSGMLHPGSSRLIPTRQRI